MVERQTALGQVWKETPLLQPRIIGGAENNPVSCERAQPPFSAEKWADIGVISSRFGRMTGRRISARDDFCLWVNSVYPWIKHFSWLDNVSRLRLWPCEHLLIPLHLCKNKTKCIHESFDIEMKYLPCGRNQMKSILFAQLSSSSNLPQEACTLCSTQHPQCSIS